MDNFVVPVVVTRFNFGIGACFFRLLWFPSMKIEGLSISFSVGGPDILQSSDHNLQSDRGAPILPLLLATLLPFVQIVAFISNRQGLNLCWLRRRETFIFRSLWLGLCS
uniref:Uncharacterized protein n=1 Tax=Picea sitchensis TaxID=3332 RepID=A9NPZ5_PICSI|nr:unknown [Picea sitchensis]